MMTEPNLEAKGAIAERAFLKRWWAEDYSWDGLAKRQLTPTMTLQDAWRDQEDKLLDFAGKRWTYAHLPLEAADGTKSAKGKWQRHEVSRFLEAIAPRMRQVGGTEPHDVMSGVVFAHELNLGAFGPMATTAFRDCLFGHDISFAATNWSLGLRVSGCLFRGQVLLSSFVTDTAVAIYDTVIVGPLNIESARLNAGLVLEACDLQDRIQMTGSAFRRAVVSRCNVAQSLIARDARFNENLEICETTIGADLGFQGASFDNGLTLHRVQIGKRTDLSGGKLKGEFDCDTVEFSGGISTPNRSFVGVVKFQKCTFGPAAFTQTGFQGTATFNALFGGIADFSGSTFAGRAEFSGAQFSDRAMFANSEFRDDIDMKGVTFPQQAVFRGARFNGLRSDFQGANFRAGADFRGPEPVTSEFDCSGATFSIKVDFLGRKFEGPTFFAHTRFMGLPLFHDVRTHSDTSFRGATLGAIKAIRQTAPLRLRFAAGVVSLWNGLKRDVDARNHLAARYEVAFQRLRQHCAEHSHVDDELLFYEAQMRVRRMRTDAPVGERWLSWAFDAFGGYGRYVAQPLLLLLAIWGAFSAAFFGYAGANFPKTSWWEVIGYSGQLFFAPPIFWLGETRKKDAPEWARSIYEGCPGALELVSLFGFIVAVALLGIFFISLRRRFALH